MSDTPNPMFDQLFLLRVLRQLTKASVLMTEAAEQLAGAARTLEKVPGLNTRHAWDLLFDLDKIRARATPIVRDVLTKLDETDTADLI